MRGCNSLGLDTNYHPPPALTIGHRPPLGGGLGGGGGGTGMGGLGWVWGGGGSGRVGGGGGVQVGRFGGYMPQCQALVNHRLPLPPPSNHTITLTRIEYWDRAGGGRIIV